jgi:type II secretory pathway pseudopilin PulG
MPHPHKAHGEDGFALVALIVAIFLILLALSVAAPRMASQLKREREVETAHRAAQYTRAIQVFYRKNNAYPTSLEQLDKTNNQRFLRQHYADPMTGEANWRLIHVGENKTTVKGFFGQELPGIGAGLGSAANLGSAAGSASGASAGTSGSAFNNSSFGSGSSTGASTGLGSSGTSSFGSTSSSSSSSFGSSSTSTATGSTGSTGSTGNSTGIGSQSATDIKSAGPIMGVGTVRSGAAIVAVNQKDTYQDWEFLYDPRIEQLKAQVSLFGGGVATGGGSGSLGSASGMGSSSNGSSAVGGSASFGSIPGFNNGAGVPGSPGYTGSTGSTGSTGATTPPP